MQEELSQSRYADFALLKPGNASILNQTTFKFNCTPIEQVTTLALTLGCEADGPETETSL